jgi:hypothetical protein
MPHQETDFNMRLGCRRCLEPCALAAIALTCVMRMLFPAIAAAATQEDHTEFAVNVGLLTFLTVPALPTLNSVALNGAAQTTDATMSGFAVIDGTGSGAGWNVTVEGQSGSGRSPVFAEYCPQAKCGSDPEGYVAGGQTLPPDSLALNSTGASFLPGLGSSGIAPTLKCATACNVDSVSAVSVASAAKEAGLGTWLTSGFGTTSLALTTSTTLRALPSEEVYRVNVVWTLSVGP